MRGDLALMLLQVYSYLFQNDVLLYCIEIFIIVGNNQTQQTRVLTIVCSTSSSYVTMQL